MKDETKETALKTTIIIGMLLVCALLLKATARIRPEGFEQVRSMETLMGYWLKTSTPKDSRIMSAETETAYYAERLWLQIPNAIHTIGDRPVYGLVNMSYLAGYAKRWNCSYIALDSKAEKFIADPPSPDGSVAGLSLLTELRWGYDTATVWEVL